MDDNSYEHEDQGYETTEVLLIKEWSGYKYGDIAKVSWGIYATLIDLKIGIPINCLEEISDRANIVEQCRDLTKENDELKDENMREYKKINKLEDKLKNSKEKIKELEKSLNYNNKMINNYSNK